MSQPAGQGNFLETLINWSYFIIMTAVMCGSFYLQGRKDGDTEFKIRRKLGKLLAHLRIKDLEE